MHGDVKQYSAEVLSLSLDMREETRLLSISCVVYSSRQENL